MQQDDNSWLAFDWYDLVAGWNAVEINWIGMDPGQVKLSVNGTLVQSDNDQDIDSHSINYLWLGVSDTGTGSAGTILYDDLIVTRYSNIGVVEEPAGASVSAGETVHKVYAYDGAQPHAVTTVTTDDFTNEYEYDANGNMTCRVEYDTDAAADVTWVHDYNAENRLWRVRRVNEGCSDDDPSDDYEVWGFYYDGDGTRVKEVYTDGTVTTTRLLLFGGMVEVSEPGTSEVITKYYSIGGMMVAYHDGSALYYMASDHLSSAALVMDFNGIVIANRRYTPFGEERTEVGTWPDEDDDGYTDLGYTGQRNYGDFGLMDYNARFYSPTLGRFSQPDTVIPDWVNTQSWNRYSYVGNSPIIYNDPTGHDENCTDYGLCMGGYTGDYDPGETEGDSGSGSGGGGGGEEPVEEDLENEDTSYQPLDIPEWVPDVTKTYLEVGNMAWWIYNHPNATYEQRMLAFSWLYVNGAAWALLALGLGLLTYAAYEAVIAVTSAACADGDCGNEASAASDIVIETRDAVQNAIGGIARPASGNGLILTWPGANRGVDIVLRVMYSGGKGEYYRELYWRLSASGGSLDITGATNSAREFSHIDLVATSADTIITLVKALMEQ